MGPDGAGYHSHYNLNPAVSCQEEDGKGVCSGRLKTSNLERTAQKSHGNMLQGDLRPKTLVYGPKVCPVSLLVLGVMKKNYSKEKQGGIFYTLSAWEIITKVWVWFTKARKI